MNNILITGGAGYIGSHICKVFYNAGFTPIAFDNLSTGNKWSVKWGELEVGDLNNKDRLKEVFEKYKFLGVVHLAALSNVEQSCNNPILYYKNNLLGSYNLLENMTKFKVDKLVFSSTAAVYGNPIYSPIDEIHPTNPINPYGETKLAVEKLISHVSKASNINFISLRYFNVAGCDFSYDIGEVHDPETHVIPLALNAAYKNSVFNIYGNDYNTNDGTCIRDYIHVMDLSEAHLLGFKKLLKEHSNDLINVGGSKGTSVLEVIDKIKKITKIDFKTQLKDRRVGDPDELIAKIDKSKQILDWTPKNSNIEKIISDAWEWYKRYNKN